MVAKKVLSWDEFYTDVSTLGAHLTSLKQWDQIVAVTRGGLVPATVLARILDIKHIHTFCISSYDGDDQQGGAELHKIHQDASDRILVVDDLVDTGKTFQEIRQHIPNAHYTAVYLKPAGRQQINSWAKEVAQDQWLVFPWEI